MDRREYRKEYRKTEKGRMYRNSERRKYYAKSQCYREGDKRRWDSWEVGLVLAHDIPDIELAKKLRRSVQAIQVKRCKEKRRFDDALQES